MSLIDKRCSQLLIERFLNRVEHVPMRRSRGHLGGSFGGIDLRLGTYSSYYFVPTPTRHFISLSDVMFYRTMGTVPTSALQGPVAPRIAFLGLVLSACMQMLISCPSSFLDHEYLIRMVDRNL